MDLLLRFTQPIISFPARRSFSSSTASRKPIFNARLDNEENNHYFQAAMGRAYIRYQETLRSDPLLIDPYIRCLLPPDIQMDVNKGVHEHCLATKFIDDKLLSMIKNIDGLRQIVLFTDGMDTRPYRLKWPPSTTIYDVSPSRIFRSSIQSLEAVGAKVPRSCLLFHVPAETFDIQQLLLEKGFNGARPSLWIFQGHPIMTLVGFKDILELVSSLAMKGCYFFGELPCWLVGVENHSIKCRRIEWMDKLFASRGLKVEVMEYDELGRQVGQELAADDYEDKNILFVAEQLKFSDDQMEVWRRELQRIEEEADEEGFEEL